MKRSLLIAFTLISGLGLERRRRNIARSRRCRRAPPGP